MKGHVTSFSAVVYGCKSTALCTVYLLQCDGRTEILSVSLKRARYTHRNYYLLHERIKY